MSRNKIFSEEELSVLLEDFIKRTDLPITWDNVVTWTKLKSPERYGSIKPYHFSRYPRLQEKKKEGLKIRLEQITDTGKTQPTTQDFVLDVRDFLGKNQSELEDLIASVNSILESMAKELRLKEAWISKLLSEKESLEKKNAELQEKNRKYLSENKEYKEKIDQISSSFQQSLNSNKELADSICRQHLEELNILKKSNSSDQSMNIDSEIRKTFSAMEGEAIKMLRGDSFVEKNEEI